MSWRNAIIEVVTSSSLAIPLVLELREVWQDVIAQQCVLTVWLMRLIERDRTTMHVSSVISIY